MLMIKIYSCYSWYNVYIDNTLILHHINQKSIDDIIEALHKTNTPYYLNLKNLI